MTEIVYTHWNRIPGKPGFKTINSQSIFGTGDITINGGVPYTGATQSLDMGMFDLKALNVFIGGPTGPRLDNSSGTIRARTNNGLADAPFSASHGTFNGTVFATAMTQTDPFSRLSLGGGNVKLAAMSAGVLTLFNNAESANASLNVGSITSSGDILGPNVFSMGGASTPGTLRNGIRHAGNDWVDIVANSNLRARFRHGNTTQMTAEGIDWMSSSDFPNATLLGNIRPNSSAIEIRAASGLRVRTLDGLADANLQCAEINVGTNLIRGGYVQVGGAAFASNRRVAITDPSLAAISFRVNDVEQWAIAANSSSFEIQRSGGSVSITPGGNLTASGRLLVGTGSSPDPGIMAQLNAPSGSTANLRFKNSNSVTGCGVGFGSSTAAGMEIYNFENGHLSFGTNNAYAMRIHASGGASIGASNYLTDPGANNLSVQGYLSAGMVAATGVFEHTGGSTALIRKTSLFVSRVPSNGILQLRNWLETSGVTFDLTTADTLNLRNLGNTGPGNLNLGKLRSYGTTDDALWYWDSSSVAWVARNSADNAFAPIVCSAISVGGNFITGSQGLGISTETAIERNSWNGYGGLRLASNRGIYYSSTTSFGGTPDLSQVRDADGSLRIGNGGSGYGRIKSAQPTFFPGASVTVDVTNGALTFEATSNTQVTVKLRGSDGVVRSSVLTLA